MRGKITNSELQEEFFKKHVQEKYPEVTIEHSKKMTTAFFYNLAEKMSKGEFPKARLKYFGIFQVYVKRASYALKQLKSSYEKELIEKDKYLEMKKNIESFIVRHINKKEQKFKEDCPSILRRVLLNQEDVENRTKFFYNYKKWLK